MSTALIHSRALIGLDAPSISVEVHLPSGLPGFTCTGINGTELRDRVKSAIQNSAFEFPAGRIVVNLGPAELPKSGGRYDLAIAAGILVASEQLPAAQLNGLDLVGELSLFGDVRPVRGVLSAARATQAAGRTLICPEANQTEFTDGNARAIGLIGHLNGLAHTQALAIPRCPTPSPGWRSQDPLSQVIGQEQAKRALTIAAAGGHHMLMSGPPGAGKTMLAERLRDLLPPLGIVDATEVAEIYSISGLSPPQQGSAPFRSPHHGASAAAITGGGSPPAPGEVSHAHRGVLFLDEMPEFRRDVIEALREPLESGEIRISRRGSAVDYPARFQLVAAMNPCPVGLACQPASCRCAPDQAQRYRNRISSPVLDRIDLHINIQAVPMSQLLDSQTAPQLATGSAKDDRDIQPAPYLRAIATARAAQYQRSGCLNAHLSSAETERFCRYESGAAKLLKHSAERLGLSARGYFRALRVARTISDLDGASQRLDEVGVDQTSAASPTLAAHALAPTPLNEQAVIEALSYRPLSGP